MTCIRIAPLSTLLLASVILAACGENSAPLAPEAPIAAQPLGSPTLSAVSNTWATKTPMPTKRRGLVSATVNGIIYAIGGQKLVASADPDNPTKVNLAKVEAFNPSSNTWTTKAPLPSARAWPSGAAVINGKIYVTGGLNSAGGSTKTLFVYNPATNTWSTKAALPVTSARGAAVALDGKLWVVTPAGSSTRLHRYDPATNTWTARASGPEGHEYPVAGVLDGKIYVVGTMWSYPGPSFVMSVYDPATNTWVEKQHSPDVEPLGAGGQVIGKKLYLAGGSFAFDALEHSVVQSYDPAIDSWAYPTPQSMPTPRTFLTVAVANGKLYALGGSNDSGALATNEVYTP